MLKKLLEQLNKGQKYVLAHDPISDTTLLHMSIKHILASDFLGTALEKWALQSFLTNFTQFMTEMLKADAYRQKTSKMTGVTGYCVVNEILGDDYCLPSLVPTTG